MIWLFNPNVTSQSYSIVAHQKQVCTSIDIWRIQGVYHHLLDLTSALPTTKAISAISAHTNYPHVWTNMLPATDLVRHSTLESDALAIFESIGTHVVPTKVRLCVACGFTSSPYMRCDMWLRSITCMSNRIAILYILRWCRSRWCMLVLLDTHFSICECHWSGLVCGWIKWFG